MLPTYLHIHFFIEQIGDFVFQAIEMFPSIANEVSMLHFYGIYAGFTFYTELPRVRPTWQVSEGDATLALLITEGFYIFCTR